MDTIQARLRKKFKHGDDDDGDDEDGAKRTTALDDIQQETLITSFHQSAQLTDLLYTRILAIFSLFGILPFILFSFSSPPTSIFLKATVATAVLSLSLTAWITSFVPPSVTATVSELSPWWMPFQWPARKLPSGISPTLLNYSASSSSDVHGGHGHIHGHGHNYDYKYLAQVLTWLNLTVVSLLFIVGTYVSFYADSSAVGRGRVHGNNVVLPQSSPSLFLSLSLLLPGFIFAAVSMVRQSMADVQSGVRDLDGLRYELKGA